MSALNLYNAKVALLTGGWSDEGDVSLSSGENCFGALKEAGFTNVDFINVKDGKLGERLESGNYDVAFIAMHGRFGEDGCIQGLLETLHIPYTCSGVLSSSLSSEKELAKMLFKKAGIPVPKGVEIDATQEISDDFIAGLEDDLGYPMFVKPASNGTSYGVTKVTKREQIREAIKLASTKEPSVLIEEAVEGTEITVPVIGSEKLETLPIVEIACGDAEFYDVAVKYLPADQTHILPTRIGAEAYKLAEKYAIAAHKALYCEGVSRSDFIVTKEGVPVILELNSIPGMTERSLLPDSARYAGIPFGEICAKLIELALQRFNVEYTK